MATVKTPATIAAAANALIPLVGTLNASGDPAKQAQAAALTGKISDALTAASNLAADDVEKLLGGAAGPAVQLQKLDQQAEAAATAISADESKVASAISFLTSAAGFAGAVGTGNFGGAVTQLQSMLTDLNIG